MLVQITIIVLLIALALVFNIDHSTVANPVGEISVLVPWTYSLEWY